MTTTMTSNAEWQIVGPAKAAELLSRAAPNRPLREQLVDQYAADMSNGQWLDTGEPIKFDEKGRLIDGQHRLRAILKSGTTMRFLIVVGLSFESQDVMDSGSKRSLSDQLAMRGYHNCNVLAAAVATARAWDVGGKPTNRGRTSLPVLLKWLEGHSEIVASVASSVRLKDSPIRYPSGLAAAIHYRMALISPADADFFWEVLRTGKAPTGTEPIIVLRERMILAAQEKASRGRSFNYEHRAAFTIIAWNHWIRGNSIQKLIWRPHKGEAFPKLIDPNDI